MKQVYLVWDLKVLTSPYLQPRVIQAQLKEEVSLNCKETTGHGWRPTTHTDRQTPLLWKITSNINNEGLPPNTHLSILKRTPTIFFYSFDDSENKIKEIKFLTEYYCQDKIYKYDL